MTSIVIRPGDGRHREPQTSPPATGKGIHRGGAEKRRKPKRVFSSLFLLAPKHSAGTETLLISPVFSAPPRLRVEKVPEPQCGIISLYNSSLLEVFAEMLALSSAVVLLAAGAITVQAATKISKADFGKTKDGAAVQIFTLTNASGMELRISTYGGAIVSLKTPDRTGAMGDVVLGFDSLDGYLNPEPYFGALIGRYGNRIGHAKFTLDGKTDR